MTPSAPVTGPTTATDSGPRDESWRPVGAGGPAGRLSTWTMTREALTVGFKAGPEFIGRFQGHDIVRFRAGTRRFVGLTKAEYVEHVFHEGRLKYVKSAEYEPLRLGTGLNLLTDEGDSWATHRGVLNPMFARRRLNDIVALMVDPIAETLDQWAPRTEDGNRFEVDMHAAMVDLTLRVVANSLFRQNFGPIIDSMHWIGTEGLRTVERLDRFGLVGLMPPSFYRKVLRPITYSRIPAPPPLRKIQLLAKALEDGVNEVIDERLANPNDGPDLLNMMLEAEGGAWPRRRVRDEALTFMLAGHETTANALSWFWYLLALHPEAYGRMVAEVDQALDGRTPGVEDLDKLPWTSACIQEAQRYFSSIWLLARTAIEEDVIDGHVIKAGTTVLIPLHQLHHDERYWERPEDFDPSRFMPGAPKPVRGSYLPFGAGRRICIGQSFAMIEMVLVASMFTQRYTFDLVPGHPVSMEATFSLRPENGIRMVARRRAERTATTEREEEVPA